MRRVALACVAAACSATPFVIDQFPVPVDLDAGVPVLRARAPQLQNGAPFTVVVDTGSPLTLLDDGSGGISRRSLTLELLSGLVPRARLPSVAAVLAPVGAVGVDTPHAMFGVIGGDVLIKLALRISPQAGELRFFPDIAGDDNAHEISCDAVLPFTLSGGGSFAIGNDTKLFAATRVVLGACLAPDAPSCLDSAFPCQTGEDALLLVDTGVAPTVLSRSSFERATGMDDAAVDALPKTTLYLDSDPSSAGELVPAATIPGMSLVAHEGNRGPCAELGANRLMAHGGCATSSAVTCPCNTGEVTCPAGATVELLQTIDVVILEDTHPLLQGLRNELRPGIADIDGLLGWNALRPLVTDLDYPHGRAVVRCLNPGPACQQRPRIADPVPQRRDELINVYHCLP